MSNSSNTPITVLGDFDTDYLLFCAVVTVGMQLSFYFVAAAFKFDKVTDFAGGTNFAVLAILTFVLNQSFDNFRAIAITACVTLWALRLSGYLLYRIIVIKRDERFDGTRENPLRFLGFWIFQMIWVFTCSLTTIFVNSNSLTRNWNTFTWLDGVGFGVFALGLSIETIADIQKFRDRQKSGGSRWCTVGVWKYSRHPNYYGELLVWYGLFVVGCATFTNYQWTAVLSPVLISVILLFASGIPPLEERADNKFGTREDYREYKDSTSPVVMLPLWFYRSLPRVVKGIFCCEFPLYNHDAATTSLSDPPVEP